MLKMSPEVRDRLTGLLPANSDFTVDFTPDAYDQLPDEYKPVFTLSPLTSSECTQVVNTTSKLSSKPEEYDKVLEYARKHIVSWSNVINLSTEEQMEYESDPSGGLSKSLFNLLPLVIKTSIFSRINKISGIQ